MFNIVVIRYFWDVQPHLTTYVFDDDTYLDAFIQEMKDNMSLERLSDYMLAGYDSAGNVLFELDMNYEFDDEPSGIDATWTT